MLQKLIPKVYAEGVLLLALVVFPLTSFFVHYFHFFEMKRLYDVLWGSACLLLFFVDGNIKKNYISMLLVLIIPIIYLLVKYFLHYISPSNPGAFYLVPFLMELKPLAYICVSIMIFGTRKKVRDEYFLRLILIFSFLIIVDYFYKVAFVNDSFRPKLMDEANYDNFIVLLGLILYLKNYGMKLSVFFFVILGASLAGQSKTGLVVMIVILSIYCFNYKYIKYYLVVLVVLPFVLIIIGNRVAGIDDLSKIDRFMMWYSFLDLVEFGAVSDFLFGYTPGVPLKYHDEFIGWTITHQSERIGAEGLHPFNYHSMWIRLILTWGFLPFIAIFMCMVGLLKINRINLCYVALILLQGFSMGVFYLSTVSVFAFALGFNLFSCKDKYVSESAGGHQKKITRSL